VKIEKISNTQMRFVLRTEDLEDRNIKVAELSYASDKTQQLFREIMQIVQDEQEFTSENESTPLMFEAMRNGVDGLVVVVTKIAEGAEKKFNLIPQAKNECRFNKNGIIEDSPPQSEDSYSVFSFEDIEIMAAAAARLCTHFRGHSQAYKMDGRYFLLMQNETEDLHTTGEMEAVLYEFGQKHVSNAISHNYLTERGELIIHEDAVYKLRKYHNIAGV